MMMQMLPEFAMLGALLLMFVLTLSNSLSEKSARAATLILAALVAVAAWAAMSQQGELFSNSYRLDPYSQFFKFLMAVGLFANAIFGWPLRSIPKQQRTEYYFLFFAAGLGMMLLASAFSFLVLYVAMELLSYSMYTLVGMRRQRTESIESSVKYLIIGASASAIGLFGVSYIYGATGSLNFGTVASQLASSSARSALLLPGLVLVLSSFLFKLAAFPFHAWAPDAYESSASPVAMFLASVSKLAGIAVLFRLVYLVKPYLPEFETVIGLLALASMTFGNFVAFRQKSVKRLFAYSSIAQAGYLMLGMIGFGASAPEAVVFYSVIYLLMNLVVFSVVLELEREGEDPQMASFQGLYRRNALMAMALLVALFSLAGVPPLAGFFGKWLLFSSAATAGHVWFVVLAILNSVVSLYYYLFLVKAAYYGEVPEGAVIGSRGGPRLAVLIVTIAITFLGIYPRILTEYIGSLNLPKTMLP
ncbi:MAG: NADH-quinone oxidoreductase subunit N [Calditrichaeota bacterium]|nr:NADH-quinone oxidoreductase subunit N [Calditrichota bacterium]